MRAEGERVEPQPGSRLVDFSAVSDAGNTHALSVIVNDVQNAPVAHADAPVVFVPSELFASWRAWVLGKH